MMRNDKICCRSCLLLIQCFVIRLGLSVQTEHESLRSEPCPYPLRHQIYLRGKSGFRKLCGSLRFSSRSNPEKKNLRASTAHGRHNKYSSSLSDRFATISLLHTILKSRKFKLILCFSVENAVGLCYCCTKRTMEGENRKKFRSVLFDSL